MYLVSTNSEYRGEMPHDAAFHLGLLCLPKHTFRSQQYTEGIQYTGTMNHDGSLKEPPHGDEVKFNVLFSCCSRSRISWS